MQVFEGYSVLDWQEIGGGGEDCAELLSLHPREKATCWRFEV